MLAQSNPDVGASSLIQCMDLCESDLSRGPQMNFRRRDSESWLDSKIPESILVIPVYQIRVCISRDS